MYLSLGLLFLSCLAAGLLCKRIGLPALIGYLLCGFLLGPSLLNVLDPAFLDLSAFLRKGALIIILCRAGFGLDLEKLKQNGLSASLMCFVPALFEIAGYVVLAGFLQLSWLDALLLGCVMGAVSPAVIVPRMLHLVHHPKFKDTGVSQVILAGASMDDIVVVTLFSIFLTLAKNGTFSWLALWQIPAAVLMGLVVGFGCGWVLCRFCTLLKLDATFQTLLILAMAFIFIWIEDTFGTIIPFASLLAVVCMALCFRRSPVHTSLQHQFSTLWGGGEMILFCLVGTLVDLSVFNAHWLVILAAMAIALLFRAAGVWISLVPSSFSFKEKLFCIIAYLPKATVQAAIGSIPLSAGLPGGALILAFAIASIILTAPIGAILMDTLALKLLQPSSSRS